MHGNGTSRGPAYWKLRKANEVARECEQLRTQLAVAHTQLENKQHAVGQLEILVRQRNETFDTLNATLEQSREQCRRIDAEADRLSNLFAKLAEPAKD
jgi:hypothetical protein